MTSRLERIKIKYFDYIIKIRSQNIHNRDGFIHTNSCDSLLFSALYGCASRTVNLTAAESSPGKWLRRPAYMDECYECGESKSTISRDMLLGVAWWCWVNKRADVAENVIQYALKHCLKMGRGAWSRVFISPQLLGTFAEIVYKLGGKNHRLLRAIPVSFSTHVEDYQKHLTLLHMLLRQRLDKKDKNYDNLVYTLYEDGNPLHSYMAGYINTAAAILENEQYWPNNRLPNTDDRADPWIIQRTVGSNGWFPGGPDIRIHSGADFLFVTGLILGYY